MKALVVKVLIDTTHEFVCDAEHGGVVGSAESMAAIPNMVGLLNMDVEEAEKVMAQAGITEYDGIEDVIAIVTKDNHGDDYTQSAEYRRYKFVHGEEGNPAADFHAEIKAVVDANADNPKFSVVEKDTTMLVYAKDAVNNAMVKAGAFGHEGGKGIVFVVGGLAADICGLLAAVSLQGAFPWCDVVYDAAATAGCTPDLKEKALDIMESCAIKIINR